MSQVVNVKYFDPQQNAWTLRRPSSKETIRGSINILNVYFDASHSVESTRARAAALEGKLTSHVPVFVTMQEVDRQLHNALLQSEVVQQHYGVTEFTHTSRSEDVGISVVMCRHGTFIDFAESVGRTIQQGGHPLRSVLIAYMRNFLGTSWNVIAANTDPSSSPSARAEFLTEIVKQCSCETIVLGADFYASCGDDSNARETLERCRMDLNMVSASTTDFEGGSEGRPLPEATTWFRGSPRTTFESSTIFLPTPGIKWMTFASLTAASQQSTPAAQPIATNNNNATSSSSSSTAAPGKVPAMAPTPMFVDPAVVSVQSSGGVGGGGSAPRSSTSPPPAGSPDKSIINQLANATIRRSSPARTWTMQQSCPLKRVTFSTDESQYNLSHLFRSVNEAIEALNNIPSLWNADYCIVQDRLLACDGGVAVDFASFRRYVSQRGKPSPPNLPPRGIAPAGITDNDNNNGGGADGGSPNPNPMTNLPLPRRGKPIAPPMPMEVGADFPMSHHSAGGGGVQGQGTTYSQQQHSAHAVMPPSAAGQQHNAAGGTDSVPRSPPPSSGQGVHGAGGQQQQGGVPGAVGVSNTTSIPLPASQQQLQQHARGPRYWNTANACILYQVTPLEMRFDITPHVGVGKSNLATAVQRLNNASSGRRPLDSGGLGEKGTDVVGEWRHDYALVYSSERQGYFLLSCLDCPCDIVACRQAARLLVPR